MILYSVKTGDKYLHLEKDGSISVTGLERCSVFGEIGQANALKNRFEGSRIVELILTEKEIN